MQETEIIYPCALPEDMHLEPLSRRYVPQVKVLCDQSVGDGFYSEEYLEQLVGKEGHFFNLLIDAHGELVGYNYNYLLGSALQAAQEIKLPETELIRIAGPKGLYGITKSMGIRRDMRKGGLGFYLLQYGVVQLFERGANSLWGTAWKQGEYIPIQGIFQRLGFHYLCDVQNVWYDVEGLHCPVCGQDHCVCPAAVFYKLREDGYGI